jgi:hypothetical protein
VAPLVGLIVLRPWQCLTLMSGNGHMGPR